MKIQELLNINFKANNFFRSHTDAIEDFFIEERKLTKDTIEKFSLGYGGEDDKLFEYLKSKGIKEETLISLNLRSTHKHYNFDTFYERYTFPIFNEVDDIVAFGARPKEVAEGSPKYTNSTETELFKKGKILYGLNVAKTSGLNEGFFYLTEGYMDTIMMYQKGYKNTIASMGTGLTYAQVHLLNQYTSKVVIAFDNDEAGRSATLRAIERFMARDIIVKVIIPPKKYKDVDNFLKAGGTLEDLTVFDKNDYLTITVKDKEEQTKWLKKWKDNSIIKLV